MLMIYSNQGQKGQQKWINIFQLAPSSEYHFSTKQNKIRFSVTSACISKETSSQMNQANQFLSSLPRNLATPLLCAYNIHYLQIYIIAGIEIYSYLQNYPSIPASKYCMLCDEFASHSNCLKLTSQWLQQVYDAYYASLCPTYAR